MINGKEGMSKAYVRNIKAYKGNIKAYKGRVSLIQVEGAEMFQIFKVWFLTKKTLTPSVADS